MERHEARERLSAMRREFAATVDALRLRLAQPERDSGDVAGVDQHPADAATDTADRELDLSREAMFEARLRQIDEALRRVDGGGYGTCVVCGKAIPDERLALVPDTPYCVADASREQARAS